MDCLGVVSHRKRGLAGKNEMLFSYVLSGYSLSQLFLFPPGCHYVTVSSPIVSPATMINEPSGHCGQVSQPD